MDVKFCILCNLKKKQSKNTILSNGESSSLQILFVPLRLSLRVRPRFFDQVGHQTTSASIGNKYFFTKQFHHHTYQNYEQRRQKLGTFLVFKKLH